jgi:hypothetical protein
MSRIECCACLDMIEVTANAVTLPFTCMACEATAADAAELQAEKELKVSRFERGEDSVYPFVDEPDDETYNSLVSQFYEDMKPAGGAQNNQGVEPSEEFASVANTTLLIADLEKQLTDSQSRARTYEQMVAGRDCHINTLESQLSSVKSNRDYWGRTAVLATEAQVGYRALLEEALTALAGERVRVSVLENNLRIANNRIEIAEMKVIDLYHRSDKHLIRAESAENHPWRNLWTHITRNTFLW